MSAPLPRPPSAYARVFGFSRLIVSLGVFSALAFSLALFLVAILQAYHAIGTAFRHLEHEGAAKHLMIAAVEQTDLLLVALALLIISFGMQALFIGQVQNIPAWLHIRSFDDLKQKLIGIVIVTLAVNFFSVALEWSGGSDILGYGAALAAVMLAVNAYSVILTRQGQRHDDAAPGSDAPAPRAQG